MKPKNPSVLLSFVLAATIAGAFAAGLGWDRQPESVATPVVQVVVPDACLVAIDKGAVLSEQLQLSVGWLVDLSDASARMDADAINVAANEMAANAERPEIRNVVPDFDEAARQCRRAGQ